MTPAALLLNFRVLAESWRRRCADDRADLDRLPFEMWHERQHTVRARTNDAQELDTLIYYLERELSHPHLTLDRDSL